MLKIELNSSGLYLHDCIVDPCLSGPQLSRVLGTSHFNEYVIIYIIVLFRLCTTLVCTGIGMPISGRKAVQRTATCKRGNCTTIPCVHSELVLAGYVWCFT